jgi:FlaA1/EpsC-like NDP-sugar epimerase
VLQAAQNLLVEHFVLISSDKAVDPVNVMGATKRVAELLVQEMARIYQLNFVAVRFGNVLGSRGSVVPLFQQQIAQGGPITITHPEMTRFFMTIPEAVHLVIQAGALGREGEIFVLDMGQPLKIVDLAQDMIELSGLKPGEDIDIVFNGLRPGERLSEDLYSRHETIQPTSHPKILTISSSRENSHTFLHQALIELEASVMEQNESRIYSILTNFLSNATLQEVPSVTKLANKLN